MIIPDDMRGLVLHAMFLRASDLRRLAEDCSSKNLADETCADADHLYALAVRSMAVDAPTRERARALRRAADGRRRGNHPRHPPLPRGRARSRMIKIV